MKKLNILNHKGSDLLVEFMNISGQDLLDKFDIRGGEFGEWLSDDERQLNLNWAYISFNDMSQALGIPCSSISLDHRLAIAFGSRGSGNALAHYEIDREVINLTRMKGAGSLAHEWGHALDYISKDILGVEKYRKFFGNLFHNFKYINSKQTEFYKNSVQMDREYSKAGHGYWSSDVELFARAFACYVKDKLSEIGIENDYLCGHSEDAVTLDGKFAVPVGEERKAINELFDELIQKLIAKNVL